MKPGTGVCVDMDAKSFDMQSYQALVQRSGGAHQENLFGLLGDIQDQFGYVPKEVIRDLAAKTGISETRIYGALTAYPGFRVRP
jgi:NADH:ubiquinone oxidoreductase subunit E